MVSDEELARVLSREPAPARVVDILLDMAQQAGGLDNITVICGRLSAVPERGFWRKALEPWRSLFRGRPEGRG
jgi:serine/threonine protein phosphatase PrpC